MKKRLLFIAVAAFSFTLMFAQNEEKYSVTTQLLMKEVAGEINLDVSPTTKANEQRLNLHPVADNQMRKYDRFVATPDTIDGNVYASCFIHLKDVSNTSDLVTLGVRVQKTFSKGFITALIPIDKMDAVAAIDNVKRIKAAQMMRPCTNIARQATNVDDILTQSADAISVGLTKKYDGNGVLLGVIDTGIDFNHIAFKDKNGNSRIKQAYVYNGSTERTYAGSAITNTLTDDNTGDHGTHTSTTAGGSSVIVSGTTVTVTDDHANATYGGMAPGADLYIAGVKNLSDTYLSNALSNMVTYANNQNQPLVVSNSWGSQYGPHDGTGEWADLVAQYFGDSHPNRVILFASSNDAGMGKNGDGGGYHVSATASSSNPLQTIIRSHYYSDTNDGYYYYGPVVNIWARETNVSNITCKIKVLNSNTGAELTSVTVTPTSSQTTVSGLSTYYSGTFYLLKDYYFDNVEKTQIVLYATGCQTRSSSNYNSNYTLAIEVYPTNGSSIIDMWGGNYCYFTGNNFLTTSGYTWKAGDDDMSVSDEAMIPNAISVGAYVSRTQVKNYSGTTYNHTVGDLGDIADFSSYATATASPDGKQYPWITAPGAQVISGVNHNHTTSVDDYSYYGSYLNSDLVVNSTTNPYAAMQGTSMATPTAAGIVALWLQASLEDGAAHKNLTVNDVKTIMQETAINDSFTTTGANASHFGKGKIDALAGIQYILGATGDPTIKATPTAITFDENSYATRTYTKTVTIQGFNLEGNITAAISGNATFSIDRTTITQTDGSAQADITITWSPTVAGTQTATITLTSANTETVTVSITGTAKPADPFIVADPETLSFSTGLNASQSLTFDVLSEFLTGDITVTLNDANGVFSVSPTSITKAASEEGATVTVTFESSEEGTFTGTVVLSSAGAESVTINLSAEAADGGSASDAYLNIAKYATIDETGWNTSLVNNFYKYTEYKTDGYAWLTLPAYSAVVGAKYSTTSSTFGSGSPQKWVATGVTQSNQLGSTTWTATDIHQGSSTYFTSATTYAVGTNSRTSTSDKTVTFYVTNTIGVKLYYSQRSTSTTYPTTLKVYECTVNSDGTLTESSNATNTASGTASGAGNLSITNLDQSKVYKVVASQARGYLYEIGFQTPIAAEPEITVNPASLNMTANVGKTEQKTVTVTGSNLTAGISTAISGTNAGMFNVSPTSLTTVGGTLTVTYAPTATGSHTATLTLSSTGATNVTVTLNGTATEPELIVDEDALTFSTYAGNTVTDTFGVLGENLNGNVTLTLNDANNVFSLSSSTATKAEAEEGKTITVSFTPTAEGTYNATVTVSAEGVADQIVNLTGTATKSYVDVTVNSYGLTTLYTDIPLEIPYEEFDDILGVYYGKSLLNNELRIKRINASIPAETAVIIQANSGTYRFPIATGTVSEVAENVLQGTLVNLPVSEITGGTVLTLGRGPQGYIGFYRFAGSVIPAGKAFIVYSDSNEAKGMNIVVDNGDDTATSIFGVAGQKVERDEWYTLQGVRLNGKPVGKGIYIHNGQRELVR